MMTRQHYRLFAAHISQQNQDLAKTEDNQNYLCDMVNDLCEIFKADNSRFDVNRFRTATGLYT